MPSFQSNPENDGRSDFLRTKKIPDGGAGLVASSLETHKGQDATELRALQIISGSEEHPRQSLVLRLLRQGRRQLGGPAGTWRPEFEPHNPERGRKRTDSYCCPLTSTRTVALTLPRPPHTAMGSKFMTSPSVICCLS